MTQKQIFKLIDIELMRKKISLTDLCASCDITPQSYAGWRKEQHKAPYSVVVALLDGVGLRIEISPKISGYADLNLINV
jgi:hypothetical protein